MNTAAYFFQGNTLLLPAEIPDAQIDRGLDADCARIFSQFPDGAAEYFEAPGLEAASGGGGATACVSLDPRAPLPSGWRAVPVRQTLSLLCAGFNPADAGPRVKRLLRAFHIAQWRRESRYCGSCGTKNNDAPDGASRLCPACGRQEFPRIAPAVITLILNDEGKALLAHNKQFTPGVYSLIAGFNEAGESLEATVAREIREEVNIEVSDIRYIVSQPWPFPHSLMTGFSARCASGTLRPDGVEIEDARWFGRDELPQLPGAGSLSRYLITRWLEGGL